MKHLKLDVTLPNKPYYLNFTNNNNVCRDELKEQIII